MKNDEQKPQKEKLKSRAYRNQLLAKELSEYRTKNLLEKLKNSSKKKKKEQNDSNNGRKERSEQQFQEPADFKLERKKKLKAEINNHLKEMLKKAEEEKKLKQRERRKQKLKQIKAKTMTIVRYLLTIPVCLATIGVVYWAFEQLVFWFLGFDIFWLVVILFLIGGTIWGIFQLFSFIMTGLASLISPNKQFSFWTIAIISLIYALTSIIGTWSTNYVYNGKVIFVLVMFTLLVSELTLSLIFGAYSALEDE